MKFLVFEEVLMNFSKIFEKLNFSNKKKKGNFDFLDVFMIKSNKFTIW